MAFSRAALRLPCSMAAPLNKAGRAGSGGGSRGFHPSGRGAGRSGGSNRSFEPIDGLGRTLTKILRHQALDLDLKMRRDGYCRVDDLLALNMKTKAGLPLSSHTIQDVLEAVDKDSKQRFSILEEDGKFYIRANQGHSIDVVEDEHLLRPIESAEEVPVCVHGTWKANLPGILSSGLKRMSRNHVHFATGLPNEDGVISGMRNQCEVLIYLDVKKALEDGMKLFMSENGVVLTAGFDGVVPYDYFEKIVDMKTKMPITKEAATVTSASSSKSHWVQRKRA